MSEQTTIFAPTPRLVEEADSLAALSTASWWFCGVISLTSDGIIPTRRCRQRRNDS